MRGYRVKRDSDENEVAKSATVCLIWAAPTRLLSQADCPKTGDDEFAAPGI